MATEEKMPTNDNYIIKKCEHCGIVSATLKPWLDDELETKPIVAETEH